RPQRPAQKYQLATGLVQAIQQVRLFWIGNNIELQLFQFLRITVQHRKRLVDYEIDKSIKKIINARRTNTTTRTAFQALAHRRKHIAFGIIDTHYKILAKEQADLPHGKFLTLPARML